MPGGPVDVEVEGALADLDPGRGRRGTPNTFVEGFVTASLVFCVGPLAILGSLSDGLGLGINQLALKSVMDGFTSIAFAASLGWGVAASALVVGVYQGTLTLLGWALGSVLSDAQIALLTATGACCWSGSPCACCGSGRCPSATCSPHCWSPRSSQASSPPCADPRSPPRGGVTILPGRVAATPFRPLNGGFA